METVFYAVAAVAVVLHLALILSVLWSVVFQLRLMNNHLAASAAAQEVRNTVLTHELEALTYALKQHGGAK